MTAILLWHFLVITSIKKMHLLELAQLWALDLHMPALRMGRSMLNCPGYLMTLKHHLMCLHLLQFFLLYGKMSRLQQKLQRLSMRRSENMTLLSCAYAGTGNVLKVQNLLVIAHNILRRGKLIRHLLSLEL